MIPDRAALAAYTIHFAYDSAVIRDSEQANLQSVAQQLAADPNTKLLIEGNCDERGTEEYNRSLGERRALAAREALAKLGVDPMRVFTRSFGKDKPADPGHDEAAWSEEPPRRFRAAASQTRHVINWLEPKGRVRAAFLFEALLFAGTGVSFPQARQNL